MADDNSDNCPGDNDLIKLGPEMGGMRPYARHTADHRIETGVLCLAKEGQTLQDGAVYLEETSSAGLYNVVHEHRSPGRKPPTTHSGPAMVASKQYKSGWDNIFGGKKTVGQA